MLVTVTNSYFFSFNIKVYVSCILQLINNQSYMHITHQTSFHQHLSTESTFIMIVFTYVIMVVTRNVVRDKSKTLYITAANAIAIAVLVV